jgi:hypothetical protein
MVMKGVRAGKTKTEARPEKVPDIISIRFPDGEDGVDE